ncbi:MAG TPA: hypothetical protein VMZ03_10160 [Chitinophagaceae bacterium]|nr:hypothetical protein [Chitinophagaceae bacterium]
MKHLHVWNFICTLFIVSCATTIASKRSYIQKRFSESASMDSALNFQLTGRNILSFSDEELDKISMKELTKKMDTMMHDIGLSPDSINVNTSKPNSIDSFYYAKYKITYIKKHRIKSANIHILEGEYPYRPYK